MTREDDTSGSPGHSYGSTDLCCLIRRVHRHWPGCLPQSDCHFCSFEDRLSRPFVEASEIFRIFPFGQDGGEVGFEREEASFHALQSCDGGDDLGHRGNPEGCFRRHILGAMLRFTFAESL